MKCIVFIMCCVTCTLHAFAQSSVSASIGITQVSFNAGFLADIAYQKGNTIYALKYKKYVEPLDEFFKSEEPNVVTFIRFYEAELGYSFTLDKMEIFTFIPAVGFGFYQGEWRTSERLLIGGSGFLNISTKDYKEIPISGIAITPQMEVMARGNFAGVGLGCTFNFVSLEHPYNTANFFLRVIFFKSCKVKNEHK